MELGLKDKVVVIPGGTGGLGKAIVEEYRKECSRVAVCSLHKDKLEALKREFHDKGFDILTQAVDVCDYDALDAFIDEVVVQYGKIDVMINNVGVSKIKDLIDYTTDELKQLMDVNFFGTYNGCKAAALAMKKTGGGVIINAASWAGIRPNAGRAPYSIAKAAIIHLSKALAGELAADNIRVLAYSPGMIDTPMSQPALRKYGPDKMLKDVPMKRCGRAEEVGKVVAFLSSDAASFINGCNCEISGGKCCVQNAWYSYEK